MKLLALLYLFTLALQTNASSAGYFEYNHMLGIWLPKHEVWTDEHHIAYHEERKRERELEVTEHKIPGIATHHVLHDHDVDHHLTFYPHPPHKRTIPRLIVYVQTFQSPDGKPLSLLPLLEHETGITHVILASVHLHETPGEIRLNDNYFGEPVWDTVWEEVKVLQENGVKVMLMLGGAAGGTFRRLGGTEKEVMALTKP